MVQGSGVTRLTKIANENQIVVGSFFVLSLSFFLWAFASSVPFLLFALVPFSLCSGILNTLISSLITKHIKSHEIGGTTSFTMLLSSVKIFPSLLCRCSWNHLFCW